LATNCSYWVPPWPLRHPSRRWYQRLLASTSRTQIKGWGHILASAYNSLVISASNCWTSSERAAPRQPHPTRGGEAAGGGSALLGISGSLRHQPCRNEDQPPASERQGRGSHRLLASPYQHLSASTAPGMFLESLNSRTCCKQVEFCHMRQPPHLPSAIGYRLFGPRPCLASRSFCPRSRMPITGFDNAPASCSRPGPAS